MTFPTFTRTELVEKGAALLAALALAAGLLYFLNAPQRARQANAKAEATEVISEAAQGAARDTITHYDRYIERTTRIDQRTEETNRDILGTVGAQTRLTPELDRAGRIALCLHDNRDDAVCELVLHGHDRGKEPAGPDTSRTPAG